MSEPTLPEWLLACIADDEATVRALQDAYDRDLVRPPASCVNHQALIIPGRVLAECEAKRRIVADHAPTDTAYSRWIESGDDGESGTHVPPKDTPACRQCTRSADESRVTTEWDVEPRVIAPCDTLRLLAVPYADRPGYRDEWRP